MSSPPFSIAILIFDDVEVMDFAGPMEVFNVAAELQANPKPPFRVFTVAETNAPVKAKGNLVVHPNFSIYNMPQDYVELLIVPGGSGTRKIIAEKPHLIDWLSGQSQKVSRIASVCTGSHLLTEAGLLDSCDKVTTHHTCVDELEAMLSARPNNSVRIVQNKRFVDQGRILTSAGIAAGIDMSLYLVYKLFGKEEARATAKEMEYDWNLPV